MDIMKRFFSKKKKYFWYVLYCVLFTIGLLYYLFPSDAFREYLQNTARRIDPRFVVSVGRIRPCLPIGLRVPKPHLFLRDGGQKDLFEGSALWIKPKLTALLRGKLDYSFDGLAYGGELKGSVRPPGGRAEASLAASVSLNGLRIDEYPYLKSLLGGNVKGSLDGTLTFAGKKDLWIGGSGNVDLKVSNGRMTIPQSLLGVDSIDFTELSIKLAMRNGRIDLSQVEVKGRMVQGELLGTIHLLKTLSSSTLDLKGSIEPFSTLLQNAKGGPGGLAFMRERLKRGKISFVIQGTLSQPNIRFL
jgi:type II secretion system protein N